MLYHHYIRKFILLFLIIISNYCIEAKNKLNADSIAERIIYQSWIYPQEKVYVSTDRSAYISGDTIRFRIFLVDANTHAQPSLQSKYVYIELINPFGKRVERIKLKDNDGIFAGIMPLDDDIPEGTYTFCAYTQFMQNSGKEYFFRKPIPILSQLSRRYSIKQEINNDLCTVSLVEKSSGRPIKVKNISIIDENEIFLIKNVKNKSSYTLKIDNKTSNSKYIKTKFDKYEKFIALPSDTTSISVTFHPEGGHLIPEIKNKLAFKAVGRDGLSVDFCGTIIDSDNNNIAFIKSLHRGAGIIEFIPKKDKTYKAIVNGIHFEIPNTNEEASSLKITEIDNDSIKVTVNGKFHPGLSLIAHNGGIVSYASDISTVDTTLEKEKLGDGIIRLLLVDSDGNILSSRMMFNHHGYIQGKSLDNIPDGDYTIKAFKGIKPDSTISIVSSLLLQSELRGHIEDPDYYFRDRDSITDIHMDLLMLTQGWERYDFKSSLKGIYTSPEIPLEIGGEITGNVKSRWRAKPLPDAVVMLISPKIELATQTVTNNNGDFTFNGFDWPEDTSFVVQVFGKSGNKEHNYTVNQDTFPTIKPIIINSNNQHVNYILDESAITAGTTLLDELVVTATPSAEESRREMLAALGVRSYTYKEFEDQHITSYEEIIRKIPGLRVVNGNVISAFARQSTFNTGISGSNVEFWVDGSQWTPFSTTIGNLSKSNSPKLLNAPMRQEHSYTHLMSNTLSEFSAAYPFHIVESIEFYRPSAAMIISSSATYNGGALVITTKDGSKIRDWDDDLFVRVIKPLGYQDAQESYQPHFIYDLTMDDNTFIAAWYPKVHDANSITHQKDTYIEMEGIANGFIPVVIRTYIPAN